MKMSDYDDTSDIAIIGLSGRFPGADSIDDFWLNLINKKDSITVFKDQEILDSGVSHKQLDESNYVKSGAILSDEEIETFDADFFKFSPREAKYLDPQHRLFLQCAWEALEDAAYSVDSINIPVGVFAGSNISHYLLSNLHSKIGNGSLADDLQLLACNDKDYLATHVSYKLNLNGPSLSIQTACSTSLVAVHVACQSLLSGECDMALAGGVSLSLPQKAGYLYAENLILSPDGHCRPFDADAQGTVQGNGVGVVLLKRLSDAIEDNDCIHAVIKGTAINNDGQLKIGYTAPSEEGQARVIAEALSVADVSADSIDYIETHGTATALGDPVEIAALQQTFSNNSKGSVVLGAVKANIGHLGAAAGVAGLIKAVLALKHKQIPPHPNFQSQNASIDFEKTPFFINTQSMQWRKNNTPRRAGVSSFGVGGTNAHVILQEASTAVSDSLPMPRPWQILALSAKTDTALQAMAQRYADYLQQHPEQKLANICHTANTGRAQFAHRLAIPATNSAELQQALQRYCECGEADVAQGKADQPAQIAFMFTGQGAQYPDMARQLFDSEPRFREILQQCETLLSSHLDKPLLSIMYPDTPEQANLLNQTVYTQPALFALEYALARLWQSWGVEPDLLIGHSVGEYVAACIAGVFSLEEGLRLIAARARLMHALPQGGAMAAVFAPVEQLADRVKAHADQVSIAAINGPQQTVVSGQRDVLQALLEQWQQQGINGQLLAVSHAFHSPLLEPMLDAFEEIAQSIHYQAPKRAIISNLTGERISPDTVLDASYWRQHVRQPVLFYPGLQSLAKQGCQLAIEIGPAPILTGLVERSGLFSDITCLASLAQKTHDWECLSNSLARLYTQGYNIDWAELDKAYACQRLAGLPTYPFERKRFWVDLSAKGQAKSSCRENTEHKGFSTQRLFSPLQTIQYESNLSTSHLDFLQDHVISNQTILPATAFLEIINSSLTQLYPSSCLSVKDVSFPKAVPCNEGNNFIAQTMIDKDDKSFETYLTGLTGENEWALIVKGKFDITQNSTQNLSINNIKSRLENKIDNQEFYSQLHSFGFQYGPQFQNIDYGYWQDSEALFKIIAKNDCKNTLNDYVFHPALLDSGLQIISVIVKEQLEKHNSLYLPFHIKELNLYKKPETELWAYVKMHLQNDSRRILADYAILDCQGDTIAEIKGLLLKRAAKQSLNTVKGEPNILYQLKWRKLPANESLHGVLPFDFCIQPESLNTTLNLALTEHSKKNKSSCYLDLFSKLDTVCTAYIYNALSKLGMSFNTGNTYSIEELKNKLSISNQYSSLFNRLIEILKEDSIIKENPNGVLCIEKHATISNVDKEVQDLFFQFPDNHGEIDVVQKTGSRLAEVLTDKVDPLTILFPNNSIKELEKLYQLSPAALTINSTIAEAISQQLSAVPEGRRLRIIEIGAGTGGTTAGILPLLDNYNVDYLYTDVSPVFIEQAKEKFSEYPNVRYQLLDIELAANDQSMEKQHFDIVVAVNVLHATSNMYQTLSNVKQLLAPNGMLLVAEAIGKQRWSDISFGMTEGWWKANDNLRSTGYPLLELEQWRQLLKQTGFNNISLLPDKNKELLPRQIVCVAHNSTTHSHTTSQQSSYWLVLNNDSCDSQLTDILSKMDYMCVNAITSTSYTKIDSNRYHVDFQDTDQYERLFNDLQENGLQHCKGVIDLTGITTVNRPTNIYEIDNFIQNRIKLALNLVHILQKLEITPDLYFCSKNSIIVDGLESQISPEQSALSGLVRVFAQEHPNWKCHCIDIDDKASVEYTAYTIAEEINSASEDVVVAYRNNQRFVPRLHSIKHTPTHAQSANTLLQLEPDHTGSIDGLQWKTNPRKTPDTNEIEIEVAAAGLNFKDILNSLGMVNIKSIPLGGECVGYVSAIGEGVKGFKLGDEVIAVAAGSLSSHVMTPMQYVIKKPENLTTNEAATIPAAFLTAYYALIELANIQPGERILIHAASGGVGTAAVQIALQRGAEVYATASTDQKRDYLRNLGVKHVMNSRDLSFAGEVHQLTNGEGIDIVLNSLTGDAISKSLNLLRKGGRFIEIGQRELLTPNEVENINPLASYFNFDLSEIGMQDHGFISKMLNKVREMICEHKIQPISFKSFRQQDVEKAFRYMSQARHIGKIVIQMDKNTNANSSEIRNSVKYLVSGAFGGLGMETSQWLVEKGARHLVLIGRTKPGNDAEKKIEALQQTGAKVDIKIADVGDEQQMQEVFASVSEDGIPVGGVIHAAGTLHDAPLAQQTWQTFEAVIRPKIRGAWLLHHYTKSMPLDFFVMYSSTASLLGPPTQSNHAAANAYLDSLAMLRHQQGLAATTINWGPWGETGSVINHGIGDTLKGLGLSPIKTDTGLNTLQSILNEGLNQAIVVKADWHKIRQHLTLPIADELELKEKQDIDKNFTPDIHNELEKAFASERKEILLRFIKQHMSKVIGISESQLHNDQPLETYGLDSLMAIEFKNTIERALSKTLPATILFDYPTANALTDYLIEKLNLKESTELNKNQTNKPADTDSANTLDAESLLKQEIEAAEQLLDEA